MRFLPRLLMLVSLAAPLAHAELLDDVHQRGALRIALEGTYPPFNFKQGGKLTGFETELGELLAAELAVKPEFVTTEWSGILAGLQSGKYDIALNQVSVNEQRRKVFDFSEPYTISSAQLIVRADLAKSVAGVNVRTYPGAPEYLQDLASKRIDAALNDRLLIPFAIREAKLPVKPGAAVGPVANMAIPYRKNNPKFGEALNAALEKIKADGRFAKLSEKWFGLDVSQPPK
ncbi:transporter substrate-binding domain-containing protein [Pseudomonas aeruginosa]|uniref:transporter substrate-binding domain-containing protein n=1 Tax=Pseudomonas aeruginosa TaxID=287 RepID=UPI001329B5C4|nr:transporter substrate-binding domain-containing protein [Pseudomonas aeruginosa]MXP72655.1 transporter substrate-binding domain-containing protein [Pseudomonas aeruginosa]MXQ05596.1 transporter substrate-binding domain-containing protein [Pseudomonas aeruginosa]MXQ43381.1 transporter substrate-binding domain-containing protein [Pseudomonas aeruginosa]